MVLHRELAVAVQLFGDIMDALRAQTVPLLAALGQPVHHFRHFGAGIFQGNQQLVSVHTQVELNLPIFRFHHCCRVDRVFQSVGQNGGQIHITDRQLFGNLDGILKTDAVFPDSVFIGGEDPIHDLVFAVFLGCGLVGGGDDLMNICQCLFLFVLLYESGNVQQEMTHIVTQESDGVLRLLKGFNFFFCLCLLHLQNPTALFRFLLFLVLLEIHHKKQNVENAESESQKFHHHRGAGVQKAGINLRHIIEQIVDKGQHTKDQQRLCGLLYQLRHRIRHKPQQQNKDENRGDDPGAEINPIQMG